jgi:phospholipid/cholesterol/gamma-HCH transport system substrate-binding protein
MVNSLIAPSVGVPVDQMSDVATMLLVPAMAGTEVSVG